MRVRLPLRTRDVVAGDGSRVRTLQVFCPKRARSMDVDVCRECEHVRGVSSEAVQCAPPTIHPSMGPDAPAGAAGGTMITCARGDVVGTNLLSMIPVEPWSLPIVDERNRFVGFVSATELVIPGIPARLVLALPARELVVGASLVVHEAAPLEHALRLMAYRGARAVALVDDASAVQSILIDIDALRAMTRPPGSDRG